MKFLAAFILSLSLMATSSFAVSLTPPMVLKMQEDRTVTSADFETEERADNSAVLPFIGRAALITLATSGFLMMAIGGAQYGNEDYSKTKAGICIGAGGGMFLLGVLGFALTF
jgi:hypothetical protein